MSVSRYWRKLKSADFVDLDHEKTVVVLPLAAVEQHGPHLPLDVDLRINEGILETLVDQAPKDLSYLILPPQTVGCSVEHAAFPGTLSYPPATALELWLNIIGRANDCGFRRFLLFNSHGGNSDLMRIAAREMRASYDVLVVGASWYRLAELGKFVEVTELEHGIHGGFVETSVMLHLEPEAVDMHKTKNFLSYAAELSTNNRYISATGDIQFAWMAQDLNKTGAVGNPTLATAAVGASIMASTLENLIKLLREVASFDLAKLSDEIE